MFQLQVLFYRAYMVLLKWALVIIPQPKPTLFVGEGASLQLAQSIATMGARRVFIVTDKVIHQLGLLDAMCERLQAAGATVEIYDEIRPDPTLAQVKKGIELARRQGSDAILAVGGGSSIDAAKMISVGLTNTKALEKMTGVLKVRQPGVPLYAVPTTAGTGSEVTMAAVMSNPDSGQKQSVIDPKLIPLSAALDPTLMLGLPPAITAATGIDALTHALEAYISGHATADTDRHARAAVRLIFEYLPSAYRDGRQLQAREALALASCYAGQAFTKANLGYVHAVAHQLGAKYHVPHGLANAVVLPHVLDFYGASAQKRLAELADEIGLEAGSDSQRAQAFIAKVRSLLTELNIPQGLEAIVTDDIPAMARGALKEAHYLYPVPRYMNRQTCEALIQRLQLV